MLTSTVLPVLRPLRYRGFAFLWCSQTLATVGAAGAGIATAWQLLTMRGSAVDLGILIALHTVANLALVPLGGLVADRFPRQRILLAGGILAALFSFGVAVLIRLNLLQVWHLYPLAVFLGGLASFRAPAARAIYPSLVPKDDLLRANALTAVSVHLVGMGGALLGGILIDLWGTSGAFAFQGVLASLSALALLGVRPAFATAPPGETPRASWFRSLAEGVTEVRRIRWVWGTIALSAVGNAFAGASLNVAIPVRIREDLLMDATVLGAMNSAGAAGSLAVALALGQAKSVPHRGIVAFTGIIFGGIALIGTAFASNASSLLATAVVGWAGLALFSIVWNSTLQRTIPGSLLGRVVSVDHFGSLILVPVGVPLLGLAVTGMGAAGVLLISGVTVIVLAAIAMALPALRRWE
ncbi:MAG: MFS transporter [SAR202 cluster bacterium]|nr:MFS transporter [SAR202 cluster bacterium]